MKIAFDSQIFCAQEFGGISRYICDLVEALERQENLDLRIVAPFSVNAYVKKISRSVFCGFQIQKSKYRAVNVAWRMLGLLTGDLLLYVYRPDVIHETYYLAFPLGPRRAKRVLTIHDMIHEKFPEDVTSSKRLSENKRNAALRADHIICDSFSTQNDVVEILGIPIENTTVVYLGLSPKVERDSDLTGVIQALPGQYLLFVGARAGYKNFKGFIEAFSSSDFLLSNYEILCFGGGALTEKELAHLTELGLNAAQVKQISGDDALLSECYAKASALIYPSFYEGFGLPPLEAMANHCPVICSDTSSIPEVVGDAGAYFNPNSSSQMAEVMESLLQSEDMREKLIKNGQSRIAQFTIEECARKTADVYKKILK